MSDHTINYINEANIGGYRSFVLSGGFYNPDVITYNKINTQINNITDTLFLNLSRGFRAPAIMNNSFVYADSSWSFAYPREYINDYTVYYDNTNFDYMRIFVDQSVSSLTDIAPLVFVSTSNPMYQPVISSIEHSSSSSYADISVFSILDGTPVPTAYSNLENVIFDLLFAYQSITDYTDRLFYEVGSPFLVDSSVNLASTKLGVIGTSYCYYDQTTLTLCPVKAKAYVKEFDPDTSTYGTAQYGSPSDVYTSSVYAKVGYLNSDTSYGFWYYMDSLLGPNTVSYIFAGIFSTLPKAGPGFPGE